jgi:electron transfer flavoprotein beta subunit
VEIIVLLKQVPDTTSTVSVADGGARVDLRNAKMAMNPYDEFAVEEALRIKAEHGGTVTVLTVGGDKAVETLRTGLAMGADKAVHVLDPEAGERDGLAIAKILAATIKTLAFDLVVAGQRAVDDDGYLVGPAVAELLGIPHVGMVVAEEIADGILRCTRTVEGGAVVMETPLPALFTTQRGLNEPRYASLPGIMKAKKKPVDVRAVADLGLDADALAPKAGIRRYAPPPERSAGKMIEGDTSAAKAETLVRLLREEAKVI